MALFTEQQIRNRFKKEKSKGLLKTFSAESVLNEGRIYDSTKTYDIFLSHSSKDDELIAGLKLILEDLDYSVYVDWYDEEINPDYVTPRTAEVLRERMSHCKSLIYAFSENAANSRWMPWELGYFDALKKSRVAVLPISPRTRYSYKGSEFIGVYYVIQIAQIQNTNKEALWVCDGDKYIIFNRWLAGYNPISH